MEELKFNYGKYSYQYFLLRQNRKTISLTVRPDLEIILKCPHEYDKVKIDKFLKRKWSWLEKQIIYFKKFNKKKLKKEYLSGESFLYLGRQYRLIVKAANQNSVSLKKGRIQISTTSRVSDTFYNKALLRHWYAKRALVVLRGEYKKVVKNFDYDLTPALIIREMNKRWGSFTTNKRIVLNPKLIQAPKECIDYIITHELCHMKYKRHDKRFYNLLNSKINNGEKLKEKLELRFL